jgi:hypothetical protein
MVSVCPRCGTPRLGDLSLCQSCGFDFTSVPVAATCPRCNAPLYPGYTQCGNCGFDSRYAPPQQWQTQAPQSPAATPQWGVLAQPPASQWQSQTPPPAQPQWQQQPPSFGQMPGYGQAPAYGQVPGYRQAPAEPHKSNIGFAVSILGVAVLAVAAVMGFMAISKSAAPSPTPAPSAVALASATPRPTPTVEESPTPAPKTAEPSPAGAWTKYTSPDGAWSVLFPGTSASPTKVSQTIGAGTYKADATFYMVMASGDTGYGVLFADYDPTVFKGVDASALLPIMAPSMATSLGGTLVSSSDSTVGSYAALDETVSTATNVYGLRMWFVGSRMYVLMTYSTPDATVYPQYFMNSFKFK